MRIQYDPEADVLLILFKELPPADAVEEEGGVILSYGEDGEPVSLELLHAAGRGLIDPEASHVTVQIKNVSMDEEFLRTSWEQQRTAGGPIGDLEEWKKLVPKAYQQLIKRAQTVPYDDMCIPYGKLGEMIGLRHLSEWFQLKIGWVVGACSEHGYQRSHPLISAMVVNADTNQPGKGFWGLSGIPANLKKAIDSGDTTYENLDAVREKFWIDELKRIDRYWKHSAVTSG